MHIAIQGYWLFISTSINALFCMTIFYIPQSTLKDTLHPFALRFPLLETVLFLAALLVLVLVLVFWKKMLLSFSHILVTYKLNSFSQVLVDENTKGFSQVLVDENTKRF